MESVALSPLLSPPAHCHHRAACYHHAAQADASRVCASSCLLKNSSCCLKNSFSSRKKTFRRSTFFRYTISAVQRRVSASTLPPRYDTRRKSSVCKVASGNSIGHPHHSDMSEPAVNIAPAAPFAVAVAYAAQVMYSKPARLCAARTGLV